MAPDPTRAARLATFGFAFSAYALGELVLQSTSWSWRFGLPFAAALVAAAGAAHRFALRPAPGRATRLPLGMQLVLAALLALPLAVEPLLERFTHQGFPLEIQLLNGLRLTGVALAAFGRWPLCRRLAAVVSVFLALAMAATGEHPALGGGLVAVALGGALWLVCEYRSTEPAVAASGRVVRRERLRVPVRAVAVLLVAVASGVGLLVAGPKRVAFTLGELMPSSGGTGDMDPFARSGVGDGPEEVAGNDARAAGMVDTEKMIEDNRDALIDVVSDLYGPPHKPRKNQERLIAGGLADVIPNHGKLPDNRRPSRDFDTHRQGPKTPRQPTSQAARGLFEVSGRVPLHIRMVAYNRYDYPTAALSEGLLAATGGFADRREGAAMHWLQLAGAIPAGTAVDDGEWMRPSHVRPRADWYAEDDRHQLKVADSRENLVPTPAMLSRFRIKRVDKPEYYRWENDGILTLAGRRKLPPGVMVHVESRTIAPAELPAEAFRHSHPEPLTDMPAELAGPLAELAAEWSAGAEPGWPRIAAVIDKLRTDFTHDQTARPPGDHPHPVLWFLLESLRGPDYLFATATALILRALEFPTRVCLGYYADPARFDPDTDHTSVRADDLHLWPEVLLRDGQWLVLEPTPGYVTLPPIRPLGQRLLAWLAGGRDWAGRNGLPLGGIGLLLAVSVWQRRRVTDSLVTAWLGLFPGRTWREHVVRTAKLLERRATLAGRPRRADESLHRWASNSNGGDSLTALALLAEWAVFAPWLPPPIPDAEVRAVCARARRACPLRVFTRRTGAAA